MPINSLLAVKTIVILRAMGSSTTAAASRAERANHGEGTGGKLAVREGGRQLLHKSTGPHIQRAAASAKLGFL